MARVASLDWRSRRVLVTAFGRRLLNWPASLSHSSRCFNLNVFALDSRHRFLDLQECFERRQAVDLSRLLLPALGRVSQPLVALRSAAISRRNQKSAEPKYCD